METGISIITTPFTSTVDDVTIEYTVTQQAGKVPHLIAFSARKDTVLVIKGHSKPAAGEFYFETISPVTSVERTLINNRINEELAEVEDLAKSINIATN